MVSAALLLPDLRPGEPYWMLPGEEEGWEFPSPHLADLLGDIQVRWCLARCLGAAQLRRSGMGQGRYRSPVAGVTLEQLCWVVYGRLARRGAGRRLHADSWVCELRECLQYSPEVLEAELALLALES